MDSINGLTKGEIITMVLDTLGRTTDAVLQERLRSDINLAQLGFWKLFDWKFARTDGSAAYFGNYQSLVDNIATYSTDVTNSIGNRIIIRTSDIERVYIGWDPEGLVDHKPFARTLKKIENRDAILRDPGSDWTGVPEYYFITGNTTIEILPYPSTTNGTPAELIGQQLWIAGKRMPIFMDDDGDYPDIPIEYQETFYQYLLWRTLSRERDPRQVEELAILEKMIKQDKQTDLAELDSNLRLKWPEEELVDYCDTPGLFNISKKFWDDF